MTARRLRAPAVDGGVLLDIAPAALAAQVATNASQLSAWDYDFQGRSARFLRSAIRRDVVASAGRFLARNGLSAADQSLEDSSGAERPLIVTGHQPELFHPGVWIKNFVAARVARAVNGLALNLIVDNDIPKASSVVVPASGERGYRLVRVPFDRLPGDAPFEDAPVRDETLFATFADRAQATLGSLVPAPLVTDFWPRVLARRGQEPNHGMRFALARRELEAAWGITNLEIPLSEVCQTDGFYWFVAHILAQLPRYLDLHNRALAEYRAAYHIRSKHHPVASLAIEGEWREAPFWVWRAASPRRRALLVRQLAREMELRIAGESDVLVRLPLAPDREACCAVEQLRTLPDQGVRLRTRALTTTFFSRLLLGDLFIHGIGGAKYDELGDEITRRFLEFEPPRFLTASMTLWMGLPTQPATVADVRTIDRALRDLRFNPERHLAEPLTDEQRKIVEAKRAAISGPTGTRRERQSRRLTIRRCNDALQAWVEHPRDELLARRSEARRRLRSNLVARNREFSLVLHSEEKLKHSLSTASWWTPGVKFAGPDEPP